MSNGFGAYPIPEPILTPNTAQLKLLNRPGTEGRFPLNRMKTVIGRNSPPKIKVDIDLSDCDSNPPSVSRRHAEISWVEGNLQILDLGSSNGTFVDGRKLSPVNPKETYSPVSLNPGSKVKLGFLEFEIIVDG